LTTYLAAEGVFCSQIAFQTSRHLQRRRKQVTAQRTTRQRGWSHLLRESLLPRDCTRNRQLSRMTFKKSDHTRSSPCWWRSWLVLPAVVRNCAARRIAERDVRPSRVAVAHGTLPPHAVCVDGGLHMHESPPLETTATHLITRRPLTSHSGGALTSASCCCSCHAKKTSSSSFPPRGWLYLLWPHPRRESPAGGASGTGRSTSSACRCGSDKSFPDLMFAQKGNMRMSEASFAFFSSPCF
jgi:hypothetical protein